MLPLLALVAATGLAAQEKDVRITPGWMPGTSRMVSTTMELRLQADSLNMRMTGGGSYHLGVKERRKDRSVLTVYYTADDAPPRMSLDLSDASPEVQAAMEEAMRMMERMVDSISRPMRDVRLDFTVGPNAEVIGLVPDEGRKLKLLDAMVASADAALAELGRQAPDMPRPSRPQLHHLCDSMYDALVETQRNELIFLLEGHQYAYPATGSRREPAMMKDVQAPLRPDMPELPAMLECGLDELDKDHAVCRIVVQYDQKALKEALGKDGTPVERAGLSEERVYRFDLRNGWLTNATRSMTLVTDNTRLHLVTRTELKER